MTWIFRHLWFQGCTSYAKEKDAAHALSVVDLKSAAEVSEERRLEVARLGKEVDTLRMNGEDLRLKLKEAVNAHDETVKAAKERELEHEQLVSSLVSEAERVNRIILGKISSFFLCPIGGLSFLILLA